MRNLWIGISGIVLLLAAFASQRLQPETSSPDEEEACKSQASAEMEHYFHWAIESRCLAANAVIRDSITLEQAVSHFALVEAHRPPDVPPSYLHCPGDTTEEKICNHVIRFVNTALDGNPRREAIERRLEAEMSARFGSGTSPLPDMPRTVGHRLPVATY